MSRMRAIEAAVRVLASRGVRTAFGVPSARDQSALFCAEEARIDPSHSRPACRGASHMADGFSRAKPGNIGVCIGTSGPAMRT